MYGIFMWRRSGGEEEEDDNRFMKVEFWLVSCFCMSCILFKWFRGVDWLWDCIKIWDFYVGS